MQTSWHTNSKTPTTHNSPTHDTEKIVDTKDRLSTDRGNTCNMVAMRFYEYLRELSAVESVISQADKPV